MTKLPASAPFTPAIAPLLATLVVTNSLPKPVGPANIIFKNSMTLSKPSATFKIGNK